MIKSTFFLSFPFLIVSPAVVRAKAGLRGPDDKNNNAGAITCDRVGQGTSFHLQGAKDCDFLAMDPLFYSLLTNNSSIELLMEDDQPIFHEGPVFFDDELEHALYFTSNRLGDTSLGATWGSTAPPQLEQYIDMYRLDLDTSELSVVANEDGNAPILMANGMTRTADGRNLLSLSQGLGSVGGGVYEIDRVTKEAVPVVDNYFGAEFNSLNDIVTTSDGIVFLTDPAYGYEQGFRAGNPQLGSNVYRYDTATKELAALVTSGLQRPNGVALVDDRANGNGCTLFLTDTGFESSAQAPRGFDGWGDSALHFLRDEVGCFEPTGSPFGSRPTPMIPAVLGIQDGIKVHEQSKLLLYCDGAGVWVWSIELHKPLGIIRLPEGTGPQGTGCTQLELGRSHPYDDDDSDDSDGLLTDLYILAETKLYTVQLKLA